MDYRGVTLKFLLCVIFTAACNILAGKAQGSGNEAPLLVTDISPSTLDASVSTNSGNVIDHNPPALLLIVGSIFLVLGVYACIISICCISYYCWCRHPTDLAARTYHPNYEQGVQFGNRTYREVDLESEANGTHPSDSLQNIPHHHQCAQSSQSIVTYATPRIAVNRPSFSETNLTYQNRLALQLDRKGVAFEMQLFTPNAFEYRNETRSLPRMPTYHDQLHFQPNLLANTASAEGLSQAVVSSCVEPTTPTQTDKKYFEETEV